MQKLLLTIYFSFSLFFVMAKPIIDKVEPMNWWVGMNNPNLQLLIHGDQIASTKVVLEYPGVTLNKVTTVENPNYLFLDLIIDPETKPGKFNIQFKNEKKVLENYTYELKARNTKPNIHQGFNSSDVIYLVMPDRFSNGNTANDSVPGMLEGVHRDKQFGRHGGDLQGISNHLDYIINTGFTALWIIPFFENNQPAYSYHGYAISDFYKADPRMGTNDDYAALVDKAHSLGLKMIMDLVFNHCGSAHWFYKDLPSHDWINQHSEFTRSNFRAPAVPDPYASQVDRDKLLSGWFDTNMPDLNQNNPFLATYLIQNTIWWLEFAGVDGLRVDTQPYPYKEFMSKWAKAVLTEYPGINIVGEAWVQEIGITAYFQGGVHNKDGYNSNMPCVTDFPMYDAISNAFKEKEGWSEGLSKLYLLLTQDFLYPRADSLVTFCDNHDLNRYYQTLDHDYNRYKMGLAFLLTTRGIPQIYYGTEILMDGDKGKGDGNIRKDFPGGWPGDKQSAFEASGRTAEQNDAYQFLSTLLKWRKGNMAVQHGKLTHFIPENGIYVYFRTTNHQSVMVILNNNEGTQELNTSRFSELLSGYKSGKEVISGQILETLDKINVPAKTAMIIDLK